MLPDSAGSREVPDSYGSNFFVRFQIARGIVKLLSWYSLFELVGKTLRLDWSTGVDSMNDKHLTRVVECTEM